MYGLECNNDEKIEYYEKTLEGEFSEEECGSKCLWGVNSSISARIISNILRIIENKPIPLVIKEHYLAEMRIWTTGEAE